jgi:hypothetical protein
MFIVTTPSFNRTIQQAGVLRRCMAQIKREASRLPKKQAQERLDETLLCTTQKPKQLSQAGELSAEIKKWNRMHRMRMTGRWLRKKGYAVERNGMR